jgi:putative addiction module CopG family antidote
VESKIKSGAYASVSEVVREVVRALLERDAAVESCLREEVVPGHQEYLGRGREEWGNWPLGFWVVRDFRLETVG